MLPLFLIVQIFLLFVRICIISWLNNTMNRILHHSQKFYFSIQDNKVSSPLRHNRTNRGPRNVSWGIPKETRQAFYSSIRVWNKVYYYFQLTLGSIKNCICHHNSTTMNVREHKILLPLHHYTALVQCSLLASLTSLGSSSLFTDPLFSLTGLTIWLLKGGGVGVLVWVRIFFPISLEIEFFFLTYKGVRFFQHYTPCWKFFWVQVSPCKISFSLEISLQYSVFLKSPTPCLKIQMFGLLEIIDREWK